MTPAGVSEERHHGGDALGTGAASTMITPFVFATGYPEEMG
jgi:hypothetical protein